MTDQNLQGTEQASGKTGAKLWLMGIVLAVAAGAVGFFITYTDATARFAQHKPAAAELAGIAFLPVDSIVISLGPAAANRHLRLTAQLEVKQDAVNEARALMPRILDTMNSYLRGVSIAQLEDPGSLLRIRLQLLHRVQKVAGEGRVGDLLITEFLLT